MAHAGLNPHNPHSAADLLRQAMQQNAKQDLRGDDQHDHIGSHSPTPSGVQTPKPDFQDKRLPGIMNSYFGQVGKEPSQSSSLRRPQAVCTPAVDNAAAEQALKHSRGPSFGRISSTSVGSMVMIEKGHKTAPTPPPDDMGDILHPYASQNDGDRMPPTPISSAASIVQRDGDVAENGRPLAEGGLASVTQALRNFTLPISSFGKKARRHQSLPVSSVARTTVSAAHISNPASSSHTTWPSTPQDSSPPSPKQEVSNDAQDANRLTSDVANEPRLKSTPPQTPRTQSHDDHHNIPRSPLARVAGETDHHHAKDPLLPVKNPRGKLDVTISEGKNLQASLDPYVVCVFEYNEDISRGAKQDKMDVDSDEKHPVSKLQAVPIRRTDSDMGRPVAVPMRSRQSSSNGHDGEKTSRVTNPRWNHETTFDVVGRQSELDISIYDRQQHDAFLGHVRVCLNLSEKHPHLEGWFRLEPRAQEDTDISGEIHISMRFSRTDKKHYGPNDFTILKLVGKGTFGQVYQVRKKDTQRVYAMKVLSKKVIIQKKEIQHTIGERNILVRTAMADSPFIVGLKFSFQTPSDLYLVTDFMSGGELFWHLQKEGRFKEDRAKFYIAELILALKHLHEHDIVYRDLKPENILLDANGHIALCDFGLSKANLTKNDTTNTFCGTTEYLAPEVLLDEQGYTKMVDFWSLGVLVFEMCCGWSPFYAEDTQQMYKNIAFGKVRFPRDALSAEGRNFVKGLLNRNPKHRLGANRDAQELIEHPFFADIDWDALARKMLVPPFKPKLSSNSDTSNFDPEFTNALNTSSSLNARAMALAQGANTASTPLSPTMQNAFRGFTFVDESMMEGQFGGDYDDDDRMDESGLQKSRTNEHRMSGVQRTGGDDIFGYDPNDV